MATKKTSDKNQDSSVYKKSNKPKDIFQKYSQKAIEIIKSFFSNGDLDDKESNDSKTTITLGENFLNETENNPYSEKLRKFVKKFEADHFLQATILNQNPQQFEVESSGLAATGLNKKK